VNLSQSPRAAAAVLALPGLALAVAGLFHPQYLDYSTAGRWMWVHVVGLFVFPLVGVALAWVVRGRADFIAWSVRLGGYLFATAYTALDVISGLAAGYVTVQLGPGQLRPEAVSVMFEVGTTLGDWGSWGLIGAALALVVDRARRLDVVGLGASAVLVLGAVLVRVDHIFVSTGAVGMLLVGLGTGVLAHGSVKRRQKSRAVGSSMPRSAS
jgi:hypothetical protein